jgi:ParB/RepB/Spo0J family partition protein
MGTIPNTVKGNVFSIAPDDPRLVVVMDTAHKLYDPRVEIPLNSPELSAMVESIRDVGILEPIIVRKVGDTYEVVDGRQRVRCARQAFILGSNMLKIPFIVRSISDHEALKHSSAANVIRVDDSPIVRGYNAKRMLERGSEWEEIETTFGAKRNTIEGWIRLHEAPTAVQEAVEAGEITPTDGVKAARKVARGGNDAAVKAVEDAKRERKEKKENPKLRTYRITVRENPDGITWTAVDSGTEINDMERLQIREAIIRLIGWK